MKNFIEDFGTDSVNAIRAGRGQEIHYVLSDVEYKDERTLKELKKDHITLNNFNARLARKEIKGLLGEFPNITASEIRGHLMGIYSQKNAAS